MCTPFLKLGGGTFSKNTDVTIDTKKYEYKRFLIKLFLISLSENQSNIFKEYML